MKVSKLLLIVITALCFVSSARVAPAGECDGVEPISGDDITLEFVARLSRPIDATAPPGDTERLFVAEQRGRIRIVELAGDTLLRIPFLNISSKVSQSGNERGLLGLAFHPDYEQNGFFYVNYTRSSGGATVVARYQVSEDPNVADANSEEILLTFSQPAGNHNGGGIAFSPNDGYLYISTGDGGSGCDRSGAGNNAQNPSSFLGKLLRIDVDRTDPGKKYAIPQDNPFLETAGFRPEIWALGLRNPWRISFDSENGDLYIGDVGQNRVEEIDYQPGTSTGGENYEWRRLEGTSMSSVSGCSVVPLRGGDPVGPVYEYSHGGGAFRGCSVTGGVVYRGCRLPDLHGQYFFADYCNDWVGTFRMEDGNRVELRNRTNDLNVGIPGRVDEISAFGTDGRGEVYICDLNTGVYRIVSADSPPVAAATTRPDPALVDLKDGSAEVTLDGSGSNDGNGGDPVSYLWEKVSGPEGDLIDQADAAVTAVSFSETGAYTYRLTVEDAAGTDAVEVTVTVRTRFVRGNVNGDAETDISDPVFILFHLFLAEPAEVSCRDALDSNDDGDLDISDAVHLLTALFLGGRTVPPQVCGEDSTDDLLDCRDTSCS